MSALTFRLAAPDGAATLASLINRAFRSEETGQTWLYESQDKRVDIVGPELMSAFINGANSVMLVGTNDQSPTTPLVTCFILKPAEAPHRTPGAAWMGFLAVEPELHKSGYGAAMVKEVEKFVVQEWGVSRLEFDFVSARVQLRAWYEKQGYRVTGKLRPFPYEDTGHEIMAPDLEMIVLGKDL